MFIEDYMMHTAHFMTTVIYPPLSLFCAFSAALYLSLTLVKNFKHAKLSIYLLALI